MKCSALVIATAIFCLTLPAAHAAPVDQTRQAVWNIADTCQKQAFLKYPDQNKDGEEKRKKFVKNCIVTHNVGSSNPMIMPPQ